MSAGRESGLGEHPPHEPRQPSNVVARSKLGHHASELGVNRNLRVHGVREQTVFGVAYRDTGLVTGGFDSQNSHPCTAVPAGARLEAELTPPRHLTMYAPLLPSLTTVRQPAESGYATPNATWVSASLHRARHNARHGKAH